MRLRFLWRVVDLRNLPANGRQGSFLSFVERILYRRIGIDKGQRPIRDRYHGLMPFQAGRMPESVAFLRQSGLADRIIS